MKYLVLLFTLLLPPAYAQEPITPVNKYVACGCGCCGGEQNIRPADACVESGEAMQKIIDEDTKQSHAVSCPTMGCSLGVVYTLCK